MPVLTDHACAPAGRRGITAALAAVAWTFAPVAAQEAGHVHEDHDEHGTHFTHPLFTESISPDTKLRLDFTHLSGTDAGDENEMELEGEYAFTHGFSIEGGMHFEPADAQFGETHVAFKFTNEAFEDAGVLLGYGLEIGLPTGPAHAHAAVDDEPAGDEGAENIYEITPFLNAGWMKAAWELVGWTLFEIPTHQHDQDEVGTGLRYNASVLYHAGARAEALLEVFGETGLSGPTTEETIFNLAPGLRVHPFNAPLVLGVGVAIPVTDDREQDAAILISLFHHF